MEHEVVVVGGGCVGVSTARRLVKRTDLDVAVVEKEHHLAAHQSGRNSGVLHPGFNYEPGSRKAEFAVEGTRQMKAFCETHGVPCDEVGVVVVAQDRAEERRIDDLAAQADANGVEASVVGRELLPALRTADLAPGYAGVRAQVVSRDGDLVNEPLFVEGDRAIHVLNAVSPGLTCSLPFGEHLAERAEALA